MYFVAVLIRGASRKLPPGPVGFPIIGSVHLLGPRSHVSLAQLARKYGAPLMSLYLGQKLFVVASSAEAAMEVLKKQDAVFCSRPPLRGFKVIFPHDVTFADLTPESNYLRKFIRLHLTTARSIEAFQHIRVDEMLQMVRSIVASPRDVVVNLRTSLEVMTANVLTRSIIGKRFMGRTGLNESEKKEIMEFIHIAAEIGECLGAKNPGDLIPALKLVDWNGLDQRMKNLRRKMATFLANIVRERREKSSLGTSNPPGKEMLGVLLDEMENAAAGEKNHRGHSKYHHLGIFYSRNGDNCSSNRLDLGGGSPQSGSITEMSSRTRRSGRTEPKSPRIRHPRPALHQGGCEGIISATSRDPPAHTALFA